MDFLMEQGLSNWRALNEIINVFNEEQLGGMLQHEIAHGKRVSILKRLHRRLGILRQAREWATIEEKTNVQR